MRRSSKKNPCPICNRSKDSDCSFSEDVVFCHQGSTHAPPANLSVGDVITRQGKEWALIKTNGGFDGAAALFKPHTPLPKRKYYSPSQRIDEEAKRRNLINAQKKLIEEFIKLAQAALDVLDFESAPPDELKESFALIEKAYFQGREIREIIGFCPELADWISLVDDANKQLNYQYKDQLYFRKHYLGETL